MIYLLRRGNEWLSRYPDTEGVYAFEREVDARDVNRKLACTVVEIDEDAVDEMRAELERIRDICDAKDGASTNEAVEALDKRATDRWRELVRIAVACDKSESDASNLALEEFLPVVEVKRQELAEFEHRYDTLLDAIQRATGADESTPNDDLIATLRAMGEGE